MADPVEIFHAAVDALNRADMDALRRLTDPEFDFWPVRAPLSGAYHGHEGLAKFLRDNAEMFEYFTVDYPDIRLLDDDRLLAIGRARIRAKQGGLETTFVTAGIATFRDGRMSGWRDYGDAKLAAQAAAS